MVARWGTAIRLKEGDMKDRMKLGHGWGKGEVDGDRVNDGIDGEGAEEFVIKFGGGALEFEILG